MWAFMPARAAYAETDAPAFPDESSTTSDTPCSLGRGYHDGRAPVLEGAGRVDVFQLGIERPYAQPGTRTAGKSTIGVFPSPRVADSKYWLGHRHRRNCAGVVVAGVIDFQGDSRNRGMSASSCRRRGRWSHSAQRRVGSVIRVSNGTCWASSGRIPYGSWVLSNATRSGHYERFGRSENAIRRIRQCY